MLEEIKLFIDGTRFYGVTSIKLSWAVDAFSSLEATLPFDPIDIDQRYAFQPFQFRPVELHLGDERIFKGSVVDVSPEGTAEATTISITGYSLPGVIQDCHMPRKSYPLQFKGLTIEQIIDKVAKAFSLRSKVTISERGKKFPSVKIPRTEPPFNFLTDLAQQRGGLLTSSKDGDLVCWEAVGAGAAVAHFYFGHADNAPAGSVPASHVSSSFSAQDYFSEITGFSKSRRAGTGSTYTEANPWLKNVLRPASFNFDNIEKTDTKTAVKNKMGLMFANMASYVIADIPSWRNPSGDLWEPNKRIALTAPALMVYDRYEFLIREVVLTADANKYCAELRLVMPGAFSGKAPDKLPW